MAPSSATTQPAGERLSRSGETTARSMRPFQLTMKALWVTSGSRLVRLSAASSSDDRFGGNSLRIGQLRISNRDFSRVLEGRGVGVHDAGVRIDDDDPHPEAVDHGLLKFQRHQQFHGIPPREHAAGLKDFLLSRRQGRSVLHLGDELVQLDGQLVHGALGDEIVRADRIQGLHLLDHRAGQGDERAAVAVELPAGRTEKAADR